MDPRIKRAVAGLRQWSAFAPGLAAAETSTTGTRYWRGPNEVFGLNWVRLFNLFQLRLSTPISARVFLIGISGYT